MLNIIITAVFVFLLILCFIAFRGIMKALSNASIERAKIKSRRFLEFKDYLKSIGLMLLLFIDFAAVGSIIYIVGKIWKFF